MNSTQKSLGVLLGFGLLALLGNSVLANEQDTTTKNANVHSASKAHMGCHDRHFAKQMAALHTALALSASQEGAWAEFVNKMKPDEMHMHAHQDWREMSTPGRFDRMLENMKSREKNMAEHALAVRAFYDTLTQEQKKIFDTYFQAHLYNHN